MDVENLESWLQRAVEFGASDLHVVVGHPPTMRLHGKLVPLETEPLTNDQTKQMLLQLCPERLQEQFVSTKNIDFAPVLKNGSTGRQRFRANYFVNGQNTGACFRIIPSAIPELQWAGFPTDLANRLVHFRNGLVLLSGVTGSGKTTTLAMIVNQLVREGGYRIITIEYVFESTAESVVTQREVGLDVDSFAAGLKYGLRQDPDVILIGEIRDRDTAQMALSAAETGHLVFATLHTRDAKGVISRFSDLFPHSVQQEVRSQLALSLRAVVSQHLLPSVQFDGKRELALEVMFNTSPIAAAIRMGKLESIDNYLLTGKSEGMVVLDESIRQLFSSGRIARDTAERFVSDPRYLSR